MAYLILRNWAVYIILFVKHPTRVSFDHCSMLSFHQPEIAETGGMRNFLHQKNRAFLPTQKIPVVVTSDWILELKLKMKRLPTKIGRCAILTNPTWKIFTYQGHALSFIFPHTPNSISVFRLFFVPKTPWKIPRNVAGARLSFSLCHWIHSR